MVADRGVSDVTQQGGGTRRHAEAPDKPRPSFSAQRKAHQFQDLAQAHRLAGVWLDEIGQALGEDPARTFPLWTAELPHLEQQPHTTPTPGQVGHGASVMAVQARRFLPASGTG
jgi:hypothetical protein